MIGHVDEEAGLAGGRRRGWPLRGLGYHPDGAIGIAVAGSVAVAVEEGTAEVADIAVEVIAVVEQAGTVAGEEVADVEVIAVVGQAGTVENVAGAEVAEGTAEGAVAAAAVAAAAAVQTAGDTGGIVVDTAAVNTAALVVGGIEAKERGSGSREPKTNPGDLVGDWVGGTQTGQGKEQSPGCS